MFVLFVGGLAHGETHHVEDTLTAVEMADPGRLKAGRQRYEIRRRQWVDEALRFDAVAINSFVLPSELEAKFRDAMALAAKTMGTTDPAIRSVVIEDVPGDSIYWQVMARDGDTWILGSAQWRGRRVSEEALAAMTRAVVRESATGQSYWADPRSPAEIVKARERAQPTELFPIVITDEEA